MVIYTDGASSNNQSAAHRRGAWAFAVPEPHGVVVSAAVGQATNNQMELAAMLHAVRFAAEAGHRGPLLIRTDSTYAIGCFSGNRVKANAELIEEIRAAADASGIRLRFEHVRGHAGDRWNEACDRAARQAIAENRTEPRRETESGSSTFLHRDVLP